jgi:hypothetical protein
VEIEMSQFIENNTHTFVSEDESEIKNIIDKKSEVNIDEKIQILMKRFKDASETDHAKHFANWSNTLGSEAERNGTVEESSIEGWTQGMKQFVDDNMDMIVAEVKKIGKEN